MKQYIITIIGATLLSAMANILSPDKWRKYISIITGFIIISCIISPISKLLDMDIFAGVDQFYDSRTDYESVERDLIVSRLEEEVAADIEKRLKAEFNEDAEATVQLYINENNEIERVSKIVIKGAEKSSVKTKRLCEIYGIKEDEVEYE